MPLSLLLAQLSTMIANGEIHLKQPWGKIKVWSPVFLKLTNQSVVSCLFNLHKNCNVERHFLKRFFQPRQCLPYFPKKLNVAFKRIPADTHSHSTQTKSIIPSPLCHGFVRVSDPQSDVSSLRPLQKTNSKLKEKCDKRSLQLCCGLIILKTTSTLVSIVVRCPSGTLHPQANQRWSRSYNSHRMTFCPSSSLIDADERGITVKLQT